MPWLKMLKGETPGRAFPLIKEVTVLGRDPACEVVLSDHGVYKRHAKITREDDGCYIEDLKSTNGTRVGNQDLTETRRLEGDGVIEIGDTQLVFCEIGSTILGILEVSTTDEGKIVRVRPQEKLQAILEIVRGPGRHHRSGRGTGEGPGDVVPHPSPGPPGTHPFQGRANGRPDPESEQVPGTGSRLSPAFSRTIFNHVTSKGQAILCEDVAADDRFGDRPSVKESQIRTLMCVPLWNRERHSVGVVHIDTQDEHARFGEDDLELMVAIAGPVSVAIENARLHEIAVKQVDMEREARDARAVQLALIPEKEPDLPGYQFWHFYEPARSVGGDYFDYRPIPRSERPFDQPPHHWAIAIGDVSGKGMAAALLMARLSSEVGLLLQIESDPARLVERMNRNLCASRTEERFITFLLALLDSEQHELTVVNAGHMAPMIRRSEGRIEVIGEERSGPPLGIVEDRTYEAVTASINPGDVVLLYTDGVNEAMDNADRLFGIELLKQTVAMAPSEVAQVGESILDAVGRHTAGCSQSDDITLLCFGRT